MCITWLTLCLEEKINNGNVKKYLKMNVSDDFFWKSFSMQRRSRTLIPSFHGIRQDFLDRMYNSNITRMQNGACYKLNFPLYDSNKCKTLISEFFDGKINYSKFAMILCLGRENSLIGHAIAILQIGNNRYLLDPNHGVFNITYCFCLKEALAHLAIHYLGFQNIIEEKNHLCFSAQQFRYLRHTNVHCLKYFIPSQAETVNSITFIFAFLPIRPPLCP